MSQSTYDISFTQGDTYSVTLNMKDSSSQPIDLSSCSFRAFIKQKLTALAPVAEFAIDDNDANNGTLVLSLANTITETLAVTKEDETNIYFWDLQINYVDQSVKTPIGGTLTVLAQVTDLVSGVSGYSGYSGIS